MVMVAMPGLRESAKTALFQPAQATKGNENRQIETTCYCECSSISLYLSTARTSGKDFRQAWAGGASGNSSVRLAACGGLQTMAAAAARCPEGGYAVNSTHRPGLATRKSSDVNGRAQSPHRPVAGVKRHDARRARPTQAQRILYPTEPTGAPRGLWPARRQSAPPHSRYRLSDNAKNTHPRSRDRPLRHRFGAVDSCQPKMPCTCIRALVARQPLLPEWCFAPSPAAR